MNTQTIRINNEIDALHAHNVQLAHERKYENIQMNLEKIKELEIKKSKINKVEELTEVMTFLNTGLHKYDSTNLEHQEHRSFNGQTGTINDTTSIDKILFKLMFKAIVELNQKIGPLNPPTEPLKCKCCKGFGNDLVQENGYCRHCKSS